MGKASSANKVARVARTSATSGGGRRDRVQVGFTGVIVAIIVVGVALVAWSRADRIGSSGPAADDQWTITYGVYVCDTFQPGVGGTAQVKPLVEGSEDARATLGSWGPEVNLNVTADSVTLPDGTVLTNGYDCGGTPGELSVTTWPAGAPADEGLTRTSDLNATQFTADGEQVTIAVVPAGTSVPQPPATAPAGDATTTTSTTAAPDASTTSVP